MKLHLGGAWTQLCILVKKKNKLILVENKELNAIDLVNLNFIDFGIE